jgi:GT2 family glycosyltransferase
MPARADLAILVLNWNGRRWLDACLQALLAQAQPGVELWVVDNGSSDGSLEQARSAYPDLRVLAHGANLGFGAAYNRAVQQIEAPLVALVNNDVVVQPGWLAALRASAESDRSVAAVGSKLLFLDRPALVNHAGGTLTVLGSAFDVGLAAPDGPEFDRPGPCGCATGAAVLLRRDAFLAAGGFDEHYFAFFEDADLCWRLWLRGHEVRYEPLARALHAYGGSTGSGRASLVRIEHCQTNRLQNMLKNLETRTLLAALPASVGFDAWRLLEFARAGNAAGAAALARGTARFRRHLPAVLAERRRVQRSRRRSDVDLFRLGVLADLATAAAEWRRLSTVAPPA